MITFPNAKINLGLFITGKQPDGFHSVETVFYPIQLCDALEFIESDQYSFSSSGISIPGEGNLCTRAYVLLKKDFPLPPIAIHLHKNIPIGAGLGGGSADAAYLIRMLNNHFELGLSNLRMQDYARLLGSDCAFFIENKPVFAHGKGDEFKPFEIDLSSYAILIVYPRIHVKTKEAYAGVAPKMLKCSLVEELKKPIEQWEENVSNDFEDSIFKNHPRLAGIKQQLYNSGALYASMSGSGSALFGIFNKEIDLADKFPDSDLFWSVVKI